VSILVDDGQGGFREISHEEWHERLEADRARHEAARAKAHDLLASLDENERWALRQELAAPGRFYGAGGTIHRTGHLDVETDSAGDVVSVWFRCQLLPFQQRRVERVRADEMRSVHELGVISGIEVVDPERQL
jgi:hypothetical protein